MIHIWEINNILIGLISSLYLQLNRIFRLFLYIQRELSPFLELMETIGKKPRCVFPILKGELMRSHA